MKKGLIIIPGIIALGISIYIGVFYYQHLRGVGPALSNPPYPIADEIPPPSSGDDVSSSPLSIPAGFSLEVIAENLSGARVIAFDRFGNIWVSRPKEGVISVVVSRSGQSTRVFDVLTGLDRPHGLLFDYQDPDVLYIAEEKQVSFVRVSHVLPTGEPVPFTTDQVTRMVALTTDSGSHTSRTLAYTPAGELLVSIGSSCNVCRESSIIRASIQKIERAGDGWKLTPYATGLRNSVFLDTNPVDGKLWATEMGRDLLGDRLPPDEINIIELGRDYGWPVCYGNRIHDTQFDTATYIVDPCASTVASHYDLPAHVAPLGIAFIPEESFWPEEYWNDVLVAYHGSWNRSTPIGYSIERLLLDEYGNIIGEQPFITGWLPPGSSRALGRPVDLVFMNGSLYISDDHAGVIYRVSYPDRQVVDETPVVDPQSLIVVDGVDMLSGAFVSYNTTQPTRIFTGRARGTMFFEASFPVVVTDSSGVVVARGIAEAQSDWMTEDFVPFVVTLTMVTQPTTPNGTISFTKDNPSGLPEHDFVYAVPVTFQP
jgi:glucose/arabinose dehydrogenase